MVSARILPANAATMLFWRVAALAWLDEMLRNFLWVPLTAHAKALGYNTSFLAPIFAENVGARFLPNLLVTKAGAKTELPMMFSVLCGYVLSFCFPAKPWAFHALAVAAGLGFMRPCVTLHSRAVCKGDLRALTQLSQQCGAARTFADVCSFILPAALYDFVGWAGVSLFGVALAFCYLVLAVPMHAPNDGMTSSLSESVLGSFQLKRIYWIDWILSGAFVSTELQWNMLNTAVPAALVTTFAFPTYAVGAVLGSGAFVAMCFLLVLPSLPRCFNQPRPTNLLVSYTFMSMSWLFMAVAFAPSIAPPMFVVGVWAFLSMANASQVVLMECLTGVNDVETSGQIMGISEMLGCAVGMLGSYAGAMLFAVAPVAPFLGCGAAALGCTLFLCLAFGVRRVEVHKRLSDKAEPGSLVSDLELSQDSTSLVEESVLGLGMIMRDGERAHSYIGPEVAHRANSEDSPATSPASSASPPYARRGVTIPGRAMDS